MRKFLSILLAFAIAIMPSSMATAIETGEDSVPVMYTSSGEEKVYANATVEDEFAENRVMVVLSNDASLDFHTYAATDFSEIGCAGIQDLSQASGRKIQAKVEAVQSAVLTRSVDMNTLDTSGIDTYNQVLCIELEEGGKENVLAAIDELMARDDVVYAGPDYMVTLCATEPHDTYYGHQDNWALEVIDLREAWDITTGSANVVVGVIDSGIDATHPDLAGRVNVAASYDFISGTSGVSIDPHGHGTHVAGIIGAIGDNMEGITGVCWNVTLVSIRVLNANNEGYTSIFADAIEYATEQNIDIINFSIGTTYNDAALKEAIENFPGLFVCAAGNSNKNCDEYEYFPAKYDTENLITVGSSTKDDEKAEISNYGLTTVDIFAPGDGILGCYPTTKCTDGTHDTRYTIHYADGYHVLSGTSMAAPYVTGVAALMLSIHPQLTPSELKEVIINTAEDMDAFRGICVSGGRLNADLALQALRDGPAHNYSFVSFNYQKHTVICDCGYFYLELHAWNAMHTVCLVCGYKSIGSSVLDALIPDDE